MADLKPRRIRIAPEVRERTARDMESRPDQLGHAVNAAHDWLMANGIVSRTVGMPDRNIISLINACYPGGWPAFTYSTDAPMVRDPEVIWLLMWERYGLDYANRIYWQAC